MVMASHESLAEVRAVRVAAILRPVNLPKSPLPMLLARRVDHWPHAGLLFVPLNSKQHSSMPCDWSARTPQLAVDLLTISPSGSNSQPYHTMERRSTLDVPSGA
jgi:hypothetical protein